MPRKDFIETPSKVIIFRPGEGVHWGGAINDNRLPRNKRLKRACLFLIMILLLLWLLF